jgi:pimeloyl-ACP methyl ester carboxylesterase
MLELRHERLHRALTELADGAMLRRRVDLIWSNRRIGFAVAVAVAALSGLAIAVAMPRGPVTAAQALVLMGSGLATGLAGGFVLRSRWTMLTAPVAQVAVFELARRGAEGATVDGIHLGGVYGVLAFLVGRGFYGVAGLLPMLVGVAYGAALARRVGDAATVHRRAGLYLRRGVAAFVSLGLVLLAVLVARPASVPPVHDANGRVVPGSIASLEKVRIGGVDQWIEIRAWSPDKPVLLSIPGGPGQSDLALSRPTLGTLAKDFVVVSWDQRGIGKSYPSFDPARITTEQAVVDTVELTNYLRKRFDERKIYLFGESGGSVIGVLAVQRHPQLYHAWIGSGQMVDLKETDRRIYRDLLAYAARRDDTKLAEKLHGLGSPPYRDVYAYGYVLSQYDRLEGDYDPPQTYTDALERSGVGFLGMLGSEYTLVDKLNVSRGLIDTFGALYPQWQSIDFRRTAERLQVPVYLFTGKHELAARRDLAVEWLHRLEAPEKRLYTYEDAGHATAFEHFRDLHRIMLETILPATYDAK